MKTPILSLALLGALAWPATTTAQQFIPVPGASSVNDITPDGTMVVGSGSGGAFYWRWQTEPAPTYIGESTAVAVSDDGTVILGHMNDPILGITVAGRWTLATGWVSMGTLGTCGSGSSPSDLSADGTMAVGLTWNGCSGRGFLWDTTTGMVELMNLENGNNRASAISGDGSTIGGFAQGTSSRTPAYWDPNGTGAVLDPLFGGEVNGFTEDGSTSVGTLYFSGGWYSAYLRTSDGTITELGALNPGMMAGVANDISEDAQTIAGNDTAGLSKQAWVWRAGEGIVSLNDRLTALGEPSLPAISTCVALSDDGSVVVGSYDPPGIGFSEGYIALLDPVINPWTDLGGGTPGINGVPTLEGSGFLHPGSIAGLSLTNAPSSTLMLAWMSFSSNPVNHFGGTVHATPFNNQFILPSSPAGTLNVATTWPVGVPSGTEVWFQFILQDFSVVWDITLSNGLKATSP
jgi:uncharacterized membrane protein